MSAVPLLVAVAVTTLIEALVYWVAVRSVRGSRLLLASIAINLMTVAPANLLFQQLADTAVAPLAAFAAVEALVVVVEIPLIRALVGLSWLRSADLALAANVCSMAASVFFW